MKRYRIGPGRQGHLRHRAGRGRAGRDRHGDRRRLGGRAGHDRHRRPGHLAHGRVRRPGLLRRGARRSIWDVQRVGPSTGLPTRTSQGDVLSTAFLSHGDTQHILLFPGVGGGVLHAWRWRPSTSPSGSRRRCSCMSDLDLGMNNWMSDPFPYPEEPIRRGKVLSQGGPRAAGRLRALPGRGRRRHRLPHAARHRPPGGGLLHPRHRPQREGAATASAPTTASGNMDRLARKFETRARAVPRPEIDGTGSRGSASSPTARRHHAIVESARPARREEHGIETDYLRVRGVSRSRAQVHGVRRAARARLRGRAEPRRADGPAAEARPRRPSCGRGCAPSATSTGCRSTPAPSPTRSPTMEGR